MPNIQFYAEVTENADNACERLIFFLFLKGMENYEVGRYSIESSN